jgi:hypothetical protein
MNKLILRSLSALNQMRYPDALKEYRACISANQYSRLNEMKFFLKDFLVKKKYKTISYHGEFQQELTFVLPFAYWHHLNGTLHQTISSKHTKELYFFSENHEERFERREWKGWNHSYDIPNMAHCFKMSDSKWKQVPLKEHYKNDLFKFGKPILIIANKYNIEWSKPPINYIDLETLHHIFSNYKHKYQIIYNRPQPEQIVPDHSEILHLNEFDWIAKMHPEVLLMSDLFEKHKALVNNFNHLQLMVYANAEHFISAHGGTAALASYFEGTNIILSKIGFEHYFNEYQTLFPLLSGARILHAMNERDVLDYLSKFY